MNVEKLCKWAGISALVFTFSCQGNKPDGAGSDKDTIKTAPPVACNLDEQPEITSFLPHEVDVFLNNGYQGLTPQVQPCFDIFSWKSFIALNWPANPDGSPMSGPYSGDHPAAKRVWEYYTDPAEVFQTNEHLLPFSGPLKMSNELKGFRMFAQLSHELVDVPADIKQATGQPLIDKNLNFALYEIKLNKDEVDYIIKDTLYTKEGQEGKVIQFPEGSAKGIVGAIEIKATWKILEPSVDDTSKFYKRMAVIYVPAKQSATGKPLFLKEMVGLVAMHILHKTEKFPFWIWSTFEQVSNAPEQANAGSAGNQYSFYNPACTTCTVNTPAPAPKDGNYIWQATKPYAKTYATAGMYGTQVVRTNPVYGPTEVINQRWQKALAQAGSVFANYRLIGSQWAVVSDGAPPHDTVPAPDTLANTTLETYIQNSSCTMTCHKFAKDAVGNSSDFSFILGHARSMAYLQTLKKTK
ncbi:MAG: hypothetical protein JST26_16620 [Bacteroidetes bacterium]|nr:hypothetical protein [Bacteroidota bacterium]